MPHIVDQFAYNEDQQNHFKDYNYHGGIYVNICVTEIVVFQTYYRIIFVLKTNSIIKQYVINWLNTSQVHSLNQKLKSGFRVTEIVYLYPEKVE